MIMCFFVLIIVSTHALNFIMKVSQSDAVQIRSALIHYIASAFGGDDLVAEFVLLQLLSRM